MRVMFLMPSTDYTHVSSILAPRLACTLSRSRYPMEKCCPGNPAQALRWQQTKAMSIQGIDKIAALPEAQIKAPSAPQVRIGIVGYGTVGRAVDQILSLHGDEISRRSGVDINVVRICRKAPQAGET